MDAGKNVLEKFKIFGFDERTYGILIESLYDSIALYIEFLLLDTFDDEEFTNIESYLNKELSDEDDIEEGENEVKRSLVISDILKQRTGKNATEHTIDFLEQIWEEMSKHKYTVTDVIENVLSEANLTDEERDKKVQEEFDRLIKEQNDKLNAILDT